MLPERAPATQVHQNGQRPAATPTRLCCMEQRGGRLVPCSHYRSCWELRCLPRLANQDHISLQLAVSSSIIQQVAACRWLGFQGRAAPSSSSPLSLSARCPLTGTLAISVPDFAAPVAGGIS